MGPSNWWIEDTTGGMESIHIASVALEVLHVCFLFATDVSLSYFYFNYRSDISVLIWPMHSEGIDDMRTRVKIGYAVLVITYLATELSILLGCQPFHKNWQIYPDPGSKSSFSFSIYLKLNEN